MENHKDQLDDQIRKLIQTEGLHKAPQGFQAHVMEQVRKEQQRAIHFQPIISTWQWVFIVAFAAGIIILSFTSNGQTGAEWMRAFDWQSLRLSLSSTFVYAFAAFTIFIVIQFYLIKSRLDEIYQ